jgi:wobble nucleotide-excising tRNase
MICKINKIKNFGVFKDFKGNTSPDFKKFNLIYGWNYSGKTTLSRVFRCLEKGELHCDYPDATFEFENETTKYDSNFTIKPNIRVFNSDFIKENLKWDTENIEPIFLLGEENITLQNELKEKTIVLSEEEKELFQLEQERQKEQSRLENALTNKARNITTLLSLGRNFNRNNLQQLLETVKSNPIEHILHQEDFEKYQLQALSTEQKPIINSASITIPKIQDLKEKVENILNKKIASSNKIQKLLDNTELSNWVEKGKHLHEGKTICEFCGNTLPADLATKLNEHFSKDFDILKTDIENLLSALNASKISVNFPADTAFYSDILPNFQTNKPLLEKEINEINNTVDTLIKDIEKKKDKPFDAFSLSVIVDNTAQLQMVLANINNIICENNKRTNGFEIGKNTAIEKLKKHFATEFERAENYSTMQTELTSKDASIETKKHFIETQKQKISEIKAKLNETVKGAERVNEYLKIFFGKDDIKIQSTDDKEFKLIRGKEVAKNLSEGEKTAISFAYFTAKLEEQNNQIINTIVYIDDPVSSLDANHLFNTCSFIENKYSDVEQLIISTHNFEFFNLIKDFMNDTKNGKEYFLVQRQNNSSNSDAELLPIPKLLIGFKSEYHYLFSIIYNFYNNPNNDFYHLYNLPNILRRYLEAFLGFKIPRSQGLYKKLDCLITDPVLRKQVWKFINQYSHNSSLSRSLSFPDLQECTEIIKTIIIAVEKIDKQHFDILVEAVRGNN